MECTKKKMYKVRFTQEITQAYSLCHSEHVQHGISSIGMTCGSHVAARE